MEEVKSEGRHVKFHVNVSKPRFTLEKDVILPAATLVQVKEALAKIQYHRIIYEQWGFEEADPNGRGILINLFGKPGTGKTLAAEAIAGSLNKNFISVGIAEIESKFMGDTSKNIQAAFRAAYQNNAVLFFDEADTLLGKRLSSVTQGVDNEVNASRSTLLMEIEKFEGIVIFSSNFAENYDKAFQNRITHHIKFILPDLDCRVSIWEKHLVSKIPLSEDRMEIIKKAALETEGFSGRDIRTVLRIALPKPFVNNTQSDTSKSLEWFHIYEAIVQVRESNKLVGKEVNSMSSSEVSATQKILGINNKQ